MSNTSTPSIPTICVHCGGKLADPQTGHCLSCGKIVMSPGLAAEFSHPTLDRHAGEPRRSPSAAYRNGHDAPAAAEEPAKTADVEVAEATVAVHDYFEQQPSLSFVLPDSRETTSWLAKTRAVRDQLLARADKAEAQASELRTEAERCRQTAAAFTSLLGQLSVAGEAEAPSQADGATPGPKLRRKWSLNADACIDCGRSDTPHVAHSRCRGCDDKWRNPRKGSRS